MGKGEKIRRRRAGEKGGEGCLLVLNGHYIIDCLFQFFLLLGGGVQLGCYHGLRKMATPYLGPSGELIEAGMDLSEAYFAE